MKALAAGLALVLVALAVVGGQLWRELHNERAHNREMAAGAHVAVVAPPGSAGQGQSASEAASSPGADFMPEAAADVAAAQPPRSPLDSARELLATPEGQVFQQTMMRRMLAQQYPDIESALGLSSAQVEALFDLIARHQTEAAQDQLQMLGGAGNPADQQELFRRMAATERANEHQIAELLGPRYPEWQKYEQAASQRQRDDMVRQQSQQLRAAITSDRNPLTDAQFETLSAALKAEEQRIDRESSGQSMQQQLAGVTGRTRRMAAVAADHLNEEQLAQYESYLQQQAATIRAMMGAMGTGEAPASAPTPRN